MALYVGTQQAKRDTEVFRAFDKGVCPADIRLKLTIWEHRAWRQGTIGQDLPVDCVQVQRK